MVAFFKERSVQAIFWAAVICIALHAFFLITPPSVIVLPGDGLIYYVLQPFSKLPSIIITGIYFSIVILQAFRINNLLNSNRMFQKTPLTGALAYILLTAIWPACNNITAALVVNSLLIWVLFRITKLYNVRQPKASVYNIGLIAGCTALLYYPAVGVIPFVFIALGVTRVFRINEWLVLLLGIITPVYFWFCYLFLTDQLAYLKSLSGIFYLHSIAGPVKTMAIAFVGAGLLVLMGIVRWQTNRVVLIQARKIWSVIFVMLLLLLPGFFITINGWPYALMLACVPASALAANAFLYSKGPVSVILFWLVAAVIVYVNWVAK